MSAKRLAPTRIGRPELIPWRSEIPSLLAKRKEGATYGDLADLLTERYGKIITPQAVRSQLKKVVTDDIEDASFRAREEERLESDEGDAFRIATYLTDHPESTKTAAADALNLPLYRLELLMPLAREQMDGYIIPPPRVGKDNFTDEDMLDALRACAKALGVRKNEPLSQGYYQDWRDQQTEKRRQNLPSPLAFRRRFGTWTKACEKAGLSANPLSRQYEGLSVEDIVVWLAHWLRSLTEREEGLIDASQGEYAMWLKSNPLAPSSELIRMRGTWHTLLLAASIMERSHKKLPEPKPVSTDFRRKKGLRHN